MFKSTSKLLVVLAGGIEKKHQVNNMCNCKRKENFRTPV